MRSRWTRYYNRLMENPETKEQIEKELQSLELGIQIARLRQKQGLNQTQLAARAGMNASKVSVIENSPQNMRLDTLLRLARALNGKLKVELIPEKETHALAVSHKRA
ncbi:MAG: helix-turn-helix transcriptional regulator [Acidobacteriota bacterium]|nr:helix-turn-helix transcriptional regulator [Acidobacteriota bacterium]